MSAASLKILSGKPSGIKPRLRGKKYSAYFTSPNENNDLAAQVFTFQSCITSSRKLRLAKTWWISQPHYHSNESDVRWYHHFSGAHVCRKTLVLLPFMNPPLSCVMHAALFSYKIVGTLLLFKPHFSRIRCIMDLNHTHSRLRMRTAVV